jgi:beta-lactamase regulating signal transducer with metallopeptidase domain
MNSLHVPADATSIAVVLSALAALLLIQSTFVLGIGLGVTRLLRPRGAAVESAGQRIVLSAALVAPLVSACFGLAVARVRIPLPAFAEAAPRAPVESVTRPPLPNLTAQPLEDRPMGDADRPARPPVLRPDTPLALSVTARIGQQHAATNLAAPRPAAARDFWLRVAAIAFCGAWLGIAAVLVVRLVVSLIGASRLIAAAVEAEEPLVQRCRTLADPIGIRSLRLKRSPFVPGPCVFGWRRPVILLPESDAEIDDDVLIHELAHIARRDCFWKTLSEAAAALLWFQPLLWRLKSRMQFCAEEVCDDFVVQFGTDRCAYADRLTRIAEALAARSNPLRIQQVGIGIVSFRSSLGRRVSRILDSSRRPAIRPGRKIVAGLVCGAAAIVFVVSLFDIDRRPARARAGDDVSPSLAQKEPQPTAANSRPAETPVKNKLLPAKEEKGDLLTIRGQVLGPDGRPQVGATITVFCPSYVNRIEQWASIARVTVGPTGLFELVYRKSQCDVVPGETDWWKAALIEIEANGLAFHWTYWRFIDASKPLVISLVPDVPIRGRVLDLQGQPVAGVGVSLLRVSEWRKGSLDSWLHELKRGATRQTEAAGIQWMMSPPRARSSVWAVTGKDGRFVIRGIRGERLVALGLRGETVAFHELSVVTRNMATITPLPTSFVHWMEHVYGANFTCLAPPGRPISGTVREATTGKPLPGVKIEISRYAHPSPFGRLDNQVLTDANGRYRLIGLPMGEGNKLFIAPNREQPYFVRELDVPGSPELGPIQLDVELHRGIWITGRAIDKITHKGVAARPYYFPFLDNPYARKLPEFHGDTMDGNEDFRWTRPDGTFRLVGLPGRAIVGVWAANFDSKYRSGVGASEIRGLTKNGQFPTYRETWPPGAKWPDVLKEINPREGVEEVHCDLVLDPGRTIHVSLVDSKGTPVDGARVHGAQPLGALRPNPAAKFDIIGLAPGDKRRVLINHEKLRIGKYFILEYTDQTPNSMTVTLEPCAVVKGRVVDADGVGVQASVSAHALPSVDFSPGTEPVDTQPDGKFECVVPAGCRYSLSIDAHRLGYGWVKDLSVEAGKTIDVGDVKIRRRN